jgi:hypothetical protein
MYPRGSCTIIRAPEIVTVVTMGPYQGETSVCAHG